MLKISKGLTAIALGSLLCAQGAFAQDKYSGMYPDFSADIEFSSGVKNLEDNPDLEVIPGLSSDYNADLNLKIKGKFTRDSEWSVEKADGITDNSGIGYEASVTMDLSKLYVASSTTSSYTSASDVNHYSLIQPMIDWYEANMAKYGLPYDPCKAGSAWPTTSYGASSGRYQFIRGSQVEKASDVNWTTTVWGDAEALYQEIKYDINSAIDNLYTDVFATGDVSQVMYASMSGSNKKLAELKMKAKREFKKIYNGTTTTESNTFLDAIDSAYIKITNIGHVADARVDFLGKRLTVGDSLYSLLAGQSTTGSAVTVSMKKGLIQGLDAGVAAGIAGGDERDAENYDTSALDYYRGISGELAVKAYGRYTTFIEPWAGTLSAQVQGIASDVTEAKGNFALDAGVNYVSNTFIGWSAGLEGMFLNWADREALDLDYNSAYAVALNGSVGAFGATLSANGQYKTDRFSHKAYYSTDRFYGYTASADYYMATIKSAAMYNVKLDFNPQYFINRDIVDFTVGTNGFIYDSSLNGTGFYTGLTFDLQNLVAVPVTFTAGADYYKNAELTEWDDYSTLPSQEWLEFTTLKAGVAYNPVKYLELSAEYVSAPSYSRRNTDRNSSFTLNGRIKLD